MKKNYIMRGLLRLGLLVLIVLGMSYTPVLAATVTVGWDSPTQNCDNSPLTDLAGFNVWWGDAARGQFDALPGTPTASSTASCDTSTFLQFAYPNVEYVGLVNTAVVDVGTSEVQRTLYFSATALDSSGNESVYSAEGSVVVPPTPVAPAPPANLMIILR